MTTGFIFMTLSRRSFLASAGFTAAAVSIRAASDIVTPSRISAITDEIARSPAEAIQFAHSFGLQWLSLRDVPGPLHSHRAAYYSLPPDAMKQAVREFKDAGIRISFLDTPFLKYPLPGTTPIHKHDMEKAKAQFDARLKDLQQGIVASHAFECPMLRIFTFDRVAEPESIFPRIADIISPMAHIAQKEGIRFLIENEYSQNAGTSAETAKLLKLLPSNVGINWDSLNGLQLGEKPYPDGYDTLPKDRIWNIHAKGKSLLDYPEHQDWPAILRALERDNFQGRIELETHIFGEKQIPASQASMKEIMQLLKAG
jgi:sugar phosphate isomerase/epimerase